MLWCTNPLKVSNIGATFGGYWNGGDRKNIDNWISEFSQCDCIHSKSFSYCLHFVKLSLKDNDGVVPFSRDPKRVPKVCFIFLLLNSALHSKSRTTFNSTCYVPRACMSMCRAKVAASFHTLISPHSSAAKTLIAIMEADVQQAAAMFWLGHVSISCMTTVVETLLVKLANLMSPALIVGHFHWIQLIVKLVRHHMV